MTTRRHAILQLDFDGTLVEGDASTGILMRFAGPVWQERIEAASRAMRTQPDSPLLIEAMTAGYAGLPADREACLRFVREAHAVRAGLPELIDAAMRRDIECHVVSYGFYFYIRDYLERAGVAERVMVHSGHDGPQSNGLRYVDPDGKVTERDFKLGWTRHLAGRCDHLIYAGDGASDIAAASLARTVFARDALLEGLPSSKTRAVHRFENLHDIASGLAGLGLGGE